MRISGLKGFQLVSRGQVTVGTKPTTFCLLSSRSVPFGLSLFLASHRDCHYLKLLLQLFRWDIQTTEDVKW